VRPGRVIIVGAGIGGMALAAALQRLGIPVVVLERAAQLGEVGAGLGILPNAVRALTAIGVSRTLYASAGPFRRFRICNHRGEELKEIDFEGAFRRMGGEGYVMHRAALHTAISACVDPGAVRTNACVTAIEQGDTGVSVHVAGDPAPVSGDLLVGADGLNSVVRAYVLGDGPPRYAGETIFRGITDAALDPPDVCREVLGVGQRAAFYDLGEGRCYWWATSPLPAGTQVAEATRSAYLQERFAGWPYGLPALFARTPSERILQNDIFDRDPLRDGIVSGSCCSATLPIRPRRTWARARAWRSRMPSCWRARSLSPRTARARWRAITAYARAAPLGSSACPGGGVGPGSGKPSLWCGFATRPIDPLRAPCSTGGCATSTTTIRAR